MSNQTTTTFAELQHALMLDIGTRQFEVQTAIEHSAAQILKLNNQMREHFDRQDSGSAHQVRQEVAKHQSAITAGRKTLRDLELEREVVVRGSDPRLAAAALTDSMKESAASQVAYANACANFEKLATPDLREAARQVIELAGMQRSPPALAIAIANAR